MFCVIGGVLILSGLAFGGALLPLLALPGIVIFAIGLADVAYF